MEKYTKEELYKADAVEVYKILLSGKYIKKFPNGFWGRPDFKENAIKCTRYMVEELLKWSKEDLANNLANKLTPQLIKKYKLFGMFGNVYNHSRYALIEAAYPGLLNPWELKSAPNNYWKDENNGVIATKWMIEKLGWSKEDIKEKLCEQTFFDNNLGGMLTTLYNGSTYKAIDKVFPGEFQPWELLITTKNYWDEKAHRIHAMKWMLEQLGLSSEEEVLLNLKREDFVEYGLGGMLGNRYKGRVYDALNELYNGKYHPWEFKNIKLPNKYWQNKNNSRAATKWMIKKLGWSKEDILNNISVETFKEYGLTGMICHTYGNSPFKAIDDAFPNMTKKEDYLSYRKNGKY